MILSKFVYLKKTTMNFFFFFCSWLLAYAPPMRSTIAILLESDIRSGQSIFY